MPSMDFSLGSPFGDSMVLQRQMPIAVWGVAPAGRKITVSLDRQSVQTSSGPDGRWLLRLDPMEAGGPYELAASCGKKKITCRDVMIGEVWLCSGQSNMEFPVTACNDSEREIAAANYPQIRLFTVQRASSPDLRDNCTGQWQICSPQTVGGFSGVGYFFGRRLHKELGVPVGLINSSVGGTIIEAWTSRQAFEGDPEFQDIYRQSDSKKADYEKFIEVNRKDLRLDLWAPAWKDHGNKGQKKGWAKSEFDDSEWGKFMAPGYWENTEIGDIDGAVWFRKDVEVPMDWAGRELVLELGPLDDFDHTYFNGELVGTSGNENGNAYLIPRVYAVPGKLVKAGKNVIAVRIFDHYGNGGFAAGRAEQLRLYPRQAESSAIPLAGIWRHKIELKLQSIAALMPANPVNFPAFLFNGMIKPLIPYGIRGATWYQGESNSSAARTYRRLLPLMIKDWRSHWGQGDFPFLIVQIANFGQIPFQPTNSAWAELREAQAMALALPKTGLATAVDVGEANDVHPKNKQDVCLRLALVALAKTYGRQIAHSGPVYESMTVRGSSVQIRFSHVCGGLTIKGPALKGFAIAGSDKKFHWADARIEGDEVVLTCGQVARPIAVRYAWADNPACTLYNKEGLPALLFRTDDWPGITT
ncbi:MAG: 9-O-acetylesterase [Planctomycetes bacterium]|nr:9-O-acetylesterase [Planctomycetota bacterium]